MSLNPKLSLPTKAYPVLTGLSILSRASNGSRVPQTVIYLLHSPEQAIQV